MGYAVRYECKEVIAKNGEVVTREGEKTYISKCEWCLTSCYRIDKDLVIFESEERAHEFMKTWKGHPLYCKPNGNYEVLEVKPVFKQVLTGYETV